MLVGVVFQRGVVFHRGVVRPSPGQLSVPLSEQLLSIVEGTAVQYCGCIEKEVVRELLLPFCS